VGRDILLGVLLGVTNEFIAFLWVLTPRLFRLPTPPVWVDATLLSGLRPQLAGVMSTMLEAPLAALATLFVLLLLSIILRKDWLAVLAGWVLAIGITLFPGENFLLDIFFTALVTGIFIFGLMRFGLLTAVFAYVSQLVDAMPVTTNLSAWFASATVLVVVILLGLAFYGAFTSIGGRTAFKGLGGGTLP